MNENYMKINNRTSPLSDLNVSDAKIANLAVGDLDAGLVTINGTNWYPLPINIPGEVPTTAALPLTKDVFVADRPYLINALAQRVLLAPSGGGPGAPTVTFYVDRNGSAVASGTLIHTWDIGDPAGVSPTSSTVTLGGTDADRTLAVGDRIFESITSGPGSAIGCLSLILTPL